MKCSTRNKARIKHKEYKIEAERMKWYKENWERETAKKKRNVSYTFWCVARCYVKKNYFIFFYFFLIVFHTILKYYAACYFVLRGGVYTTHHTHASKNHRFLFPIPTVPPFRPFSRRSFWLLFNLSLILFLFDLCFLFVAIHAVYIIANQKKRKKKNKNKK